MAGSKLNTWDLRKTTFYLVCLFVFLRKVKITGLRQKLIYFILLIQSVNQKE